MSQIDQEAERTKLERTLVKSGRQDLVLDLMALGRAELEERMKQQALYRQESLMAKSEDESLKEAKATARELAAPYNDSIRMNEKISRFISFLLKDLA